jgi:hypothetical protein
MTITIVDVVEYKYPMQIQKGNVSFRQVSKDEIQIALWTVPNEPQPTEQELIDFGIANARAIEIYLTSIDASNQSQLVIDSTARSKGYGDGVSCASYATSTNVLWKNESIAFIAWRDSVWDYLYALLARISGGSDPIPSVQQIIDGIPPIIWPN